MRIVINVESEVFLPNRTPNNPAIRYYAALSGIPQEALWHAQSRTGEDLAFIYFTSGTTGPAKMVAHAHYFTRSAKLQALHWNRLQRDDCNYTPSDQGWIGFNYNVFGTLAVGATLFIQQAPPGPLSLEHLIQILHRFPITLMGGSPPFYILLTSDIGRNLLKRYPPKALKKSTCGGDTLSAEVWQKIFEQTGFALEHLIKVYGRTLSKTIFLTVAGCRSPKGLGRLKRPSAFITNRIWGCVVALGA